MEGVEGEKSRRKMLEAIRATEIHMSLSSIAMGMLQGLSIRFIGEIIPGQLRSRGRLPGEGCQKQQSWIICGNIFSAF